MGKQIKIVEIKAYLPDKLKNDIDILLYDVIDSDMDLVIIIDGKEGSGKSYDARLIGKYVSTVTKTPFTPKNIHFTTDDYIKFSENAPELAINVLDESREALNKKRGMSKSNVKFTNWLSENRDKRQIHILVLPAIHDLDNYVAVWRMKLLIHKLVGHIPNAKSRSKYSLMRGYFKVYENNKDLQRVIFNKAKYGYYAYPKEFKYRRKIHYNEVFNKQELTDYKTKKATKRKAKYDGTQTISKKDIAQKKRESNLVKYLREKGETFVSISKNTGLDRKYVSDLSKFDVGEGCV